MSYDPNNLWSEVEDNAVRQFYPRHGSKWAGWSEVLPNRTTRAISARAARLGVTRVRKNPKVDERNIKFDYTKEPDPNERVRAGVHERRPDSHRDRQEAALVVWNDHKDTDRKVGKGK